MNILWAIVVGIVAGWLAGVLVKGGGFGLLGNLLVGIIGSFVGGFVFNALNIAAYGSIGSFVTMVVGAVVFLLLISLIKKTA